MNAETHSHVFATEPSAHLSGVGIVYEIFDCVSEVLSRCNGAVKLTYSSGPCTREEIMDAGYLSALRKIMSDIERDASDAEDGQRCTWNAEWDETAHAWIAYDCYAYGESTLTLVVDGVSFEHTLCPEHEAEAEAEGLIM